MKAPVEKKTPEKPAPKVKSNLVAVLPERSWSEDEMLTEIRKLRTEQHDWIIEHATRTSWKDQVTRRQGIIEGLNMWEDFLRKG